MAKLTQEELNVLQENQKELNILISNIGIIVIGIEEVESQATDLRKQKQNLFNQLKSLQSKADEFNKQLADKYGDGEVNISTGDVTLSKSI